MCILLTLLSIINLKYFLKIYFWSQIPALVVVFSIYIPLSDMYISPIKRSWYFYSSSWIVISLHFLFWASLTGKFKLVNVNIAYFSSIFSFISVSKEKFIFIPTWIFFTINIIFRSSEHLLKDRKKVSLKKLVLTKKNNLHWEKRSHGHLQITVWKFVLNIHYMGITL